MRVAFTKTSKWLSAMCVVAGLLPDTAWSDQSVPVPRVVIYSGSVIADSALVDREIKFGPEPERTWHMSRSALVGKVARRTLLPGQAIALLAVKPPDLVQAGQHTTLVFEVGRLTIVGSGIALQAGGAGDRISLQNVESRAIVRGVVAQDGSVWMGD